MKNPALLSLCALIVLPVCATASTFTWSYGGLGDPVYASGTLPATPDASIAGAYDISGGTGTRTDGTGTYAVSIVSFSQSNDPSACSYSTSSGCTVVANGGVSADFIFDNLLYAANGAGSLLDQDGIVLAEPTGPAATYFSISSAQYSAAPPDVEFDPYYYTETFLDNPFSATLVPDAPAPEPTELLLTGTGILGLLIRRRFAR